MEDEDDPIVEFKENKRKTRTLKYTQLELEHSEAQVFDQVLSFLYSGSIKINLSNVIPLSKVAQQLEINKLLYLTVQFLQNNINKQTAPDLLKQAIESNAKPIIDQCMDIFARHFSHLISVKYDFRQLPIEVMLQLLNHPELSAESEADVYQTIRVYLEQFDSDDAERNSKLFSTVRFACLDYVNLEHAYNNEMVPKSLLSEALMARLATHENPDRTKMNSRHLQRPSSHRRIFEYSNDFDKKGILYFIATNGGRSEWQNPAKTGEIKVTGSSIEKGQYEFICELEPQECWSADVPASWFTIDMGKDRAVKPTSYTLRHGGASRQDSLRDWALKGSIDCNTWTTLERHKDDNSLNGNYAAHSWEIKNAVQPWRFFRIVQTGHNSSGHNFLSLNGIEFYGELYCL